MNFAAEPRKRCEAEHYKVFVGRDSLAYHRRRLVQGGQRGTVPSRFYPPQVLKAYAFTSGTSLLAVNKPTITPSAVIARTKDPELDNVVLMENGKNIAVSTNTPRQSAG